MRTDTHSPSAGHARLHPAHDSRRGHREQPPHAFDENESGGFSRILGTLPLVCGLTALAGVLLATLGTALTLSAPDPVSLIPLVSRISVGLASLLGGMLAARRNPASPLMGGLISGMLMALLLTVVGMCIGGEESAATWVMRLCIPLVHLLGAYVARPRPKAVQHGAHAAGRHRH